MNAIPTPIPVFVDNCIDSISDTMQSATKEGELEVGGAHQKYRVVGFERRPLPNEREAWKREQIECLPTISRLAREQQLILQTYSELRHEGWKRPRSFPRTLIGNVFEGVLFQEVDAAVERSYFFHLELGSYLQKSTMVEFCSWLLNSGIERSIDILASTEKYPESLLENLRNLERFRGICRHVSESQYPDAFHFWSAEVNGARYFLTIDRKLINTLSAPKDLLGTCTPVSPSQLLSNLGVTERDGFQYEEGVFYNISGIPI